jgi:hypothetical protein
VATYQKDSLFLDLIERFTHNEPEGTGLQIVFRIGGQYAIENGSGAEELDLGRDPVALHSALRSGRFCHPAW